LSSCPATAQAAYRPRGCDVARRVVAGLAPAHRDRQAAHSGLVTRGVEVWELVRLGVLSGAIAVDLDTLPARLDTPAPPSRQSSLPARRSPPAQVRWPPARCGGVLTAPECFSVPARRAISERSSCWSPQCAHMRGVPVAVSPLHVSAPDTTFASRVRSFSARDAGLPRTPAGILVP